MSTIEKTLEKWKKTRQPVPRQEVVAIVNRFFPATYRSKKGSHLVVWHPLLKGIQGFGARGEFTIAVEHGKKVKPVYVRRLADVIEYLKSKATCEEEESDSEKES